MGSNPAGLTHVCLIYVLSDTGLCVGLITGPEESYELWCLSVNPKLHGRDLEPRTGCRVTGIKLCYHLKGDCCQHVAKQRHIDQRERERAKDSKREC